MKGYEFTTRTSLLGRTPVIIRLDGKAFHTYTSKMPRPFYEPLHQLMVETTEYLCKEVGTCQLGYTQSDEISLLLKDWTKFNTQAWFDNQVQKMVSTSAAIATAIFNDLAPSYLEAQYRRQRFGLFDSRVFNLPMEEVCNYFIWRQQDATRNSINAVGQANFSHKDLQYKSTNDVQQMLLTQKDINWNDFPTWAKRGTCVRREEVELEVGAQWVIDYEIPIFSQERPYINSLLPPEQE